jgi:hypothetical protein
MKKILQSIVCLSISLPILNAQTHVNREWATTSGNPYALQWSASIVSAADELISVGNTSVAGQGANILLTKYTGTGAIAWQRNFNAGAAKNDYGVALARDNAGNIIVCGITDNSTTTNADIVLLKYNSAGTLLWSKTYNSTFSKNDAGTAIKIDASNNIYVAGSSEGSVTNNFDYLLLKYTSAGVLTWSNRYDYAGLTEVPVSITIDASSNIVVAGGSASSTTKWDYALAKYSPAGVYMGATRTTLPSTTGFDQPYDMEKDAAGNIYVTGKSSVDGINYNIKTVKFNSAYAIVWSQVYDGYGKEDLAYSLDIDAAGNVVVGGYATKSNNIKEMVAIKYNAAGTQLWRNNITGTNETADAYIKAITANDIGQYIILAEEKNLAGNKNVLVGKINADGGYIWNKSLQTTVDEIPLDINVASDGSVYISTVRTSASNSYRTYKYSDYTMNQNVINNATGQPVAKANELLVRFQASAMNVAAVDNTIGTKQIEFGDLSYFLTPAAYTAFRTAIGNVCGTETSPQLCSFTAIKVFKQDLTTQLTTSTNLGETIKIPDFWTTLLIVFPTNLNLNQTLTKLNSIPTIVAYSHANYIIKPTSVKLAKSDLVCRLDFPDTNSKVLIGANDPLYNSNQHSLHKISGSVFNNADINIEPAWDIIPSGGSSRIRCGVFDDGVDWKHKDFGWDFSNPSTSKIVAGWDFESNSDLKLLNFGYGLHGTQVTGIIGGVRNNNDGIAGIAGGNDLVPSGLSSKGISLYALRIFSYVQPPVFSYTLNYVADAIKNSSFLGQNYSYGLNLQSHSWTIGVQNAASLFTDTNIQLLSDAVHFANRNKVTVIAGRGNDGINAPSYPATFDDDWVINVGGTGDDGCFIHKSTIAGTPYNLGNVNGSFTASYGSNLDIAAPASDNMVYSMDFFNHFAYAPFAGTSSSAPHVSGVVGLLMSYLNTTSNSDFDKYNYNLAPEDCEQIIQHSAKDDNCITGYDDFVGHGRLDAGAALKLVEKPKNRLKHFGTSIYSQSTNSKTTVLFASSQSVSLTEDYKNNTNQWFKKGNYVVNIYKTNITVNHTLLPGDSIITFWPRNSSSSPFAYITSNSITPHEKIKINTCNNTNCSMSGYFYEVINNGVTIGWWPNNPNVTGSTNIEFEYSILVKNNNPPPVGINYVAPSINSLSLMPNPSNGLQTLKLNTNSIEKLQIILMDITGKTIKNMYSGISESGLNKIPLNVQDLANGIYLYKVQLGETKSYLRFIKQ